MSLTYEPSSEPLHIMQSSCSYTVEDGRELLAGLRRAIERERERGGGGER